MIFFENIFLDESLKNYEKNMLLALQLIKNSTIQIKNIALATGFDSSSKFTAAFKKRFGLLPSDSRIS